MAAQPGRWRGLALISSRGRGKVPRLLGGPSACARSGGGPRTGERVRKRPGFTSATARTAMTSAAPSSRRLGGSLRRPRARRLRQGPTVVVGVPTNTVLGSSTSLTTSAPRGCRGARDITVVNQPPSVDITQQADGEQVTQGLSYTLRAIAHDVDEPGLPCANYVWERVDGPSPRQLCRGCAVTVAFTNLGSHAIRVTVTDSFGATASDVHTIEVVKCGDTGPPWWPSPARRRATPCRLSSRPSWLPTPRTPTATRCRSPGRCPGRAAGRW